MIWAVRAAFEKGGLATEETRPQDERRVPKSKGAEIKTRQMLRQVGRHCT
jgi:hypothetical protein